MQNLLSGLLDPAAFLAVLAFAVSTPLLAGILVVNVVEKEYPLGAAISSVARAAQSLFVVGILISLLGIAAAFWHGSWVIGMMFILASLVAIVVYGRYVVGLERA